jgi:6-phosphogluconolactonase
VKNFELIHFADDCALADAVAEKWLKEIEVANHSGRAYSVALSGGRIARKLFASAAKQTTERRLTLGLVQFFWADERCVPPNDPESNFHVAHELLFAPLQIEDAQIHRVKGEASADFAAAQAEAEICRIAPLNSDGQPALDLILLGMGEDGHVASLFPGEPKSVMASPAVYRAVTAPKPPPRRITMGYKAIAAAREVWVLASGLGKEAALRESLGPRGKTPLARVLRSRHSTRVFTELKVG